VAGKKENDDTMEAVLSETVEDAKLRELVESELENLQLGVRIAKLRAAENLSQRRR
jgi:hypothetical protein